MEVDRVLHRLRYRGSLALAKAIGSLAARYATENSNCYDLGCSLGAATLAFAWAVDVVFTPALCSTLRVTAGAGTGSPA